MPGTWERLIAPARLPSAGDAEAAAGAMGGGVLGVGGGVGGGEDREMTLFPRRPAATDRLSLLSRPQIKLQTSEANLGWRRFP